MNGTRRLAALGLLTALTAPSLAIPVVAPEPMINRVAVSDVVVVGKVTAIEDKTVKVKLGAGQPEYDFQVAVVQVGQGILGAEGLKQVRVAFAPGDGRSRLAVGVEGLLFLRHDERDPTFFIPAPVVYCFVGKTSDTFAKDVKDAAAYAALLADPDKGLQSEDAKVRYLTAAMLVRRYRTPPALGRKQEPIDAAQSRRILAEIAAADWKAKRPDELAGTYPRTLFEMVGPTEKDGWRDRTTAEYGAAAEKWTKENVSTFRIKKYVTDK